MTTLTAIYYSSQTVISVLEFIEKRNFLSYNGYLLKLNFFCTRPNFGLRASGSKKAKATKKEEKGNIIRTTTKVPLFNRKNPINHGSKNPLKPPSQTENYTLFSGFFIKDLVVKSKNFDQKIATALKQKPVPHIPCGSTKASNNWSAIWKLENNILSSKTVFGNALTILRLWEPNSPPLHTDLDLEQWLVRLSRIGTIEAADAYWGISRGLELLPKNLERRATNTPNYFKKEHTPYVKEEVERVFKLKHIASYEDMKAIFPSLPNIPEDRLGLGFVLKTKEDGSLKFRLIVDASRPEGESVNAHMAEFATALPTVSGFARHMFKDAYFAMADVADAFMNLGLKPYNWKNVVINFNLDGSNVDLAYTSLAFGLRSAVRMFQGIADLMLQMIRHECQDRGFYHLIKHDTSYIDDSACISSTKKGAKDWLKAWKDTMNHLGMPWQVKKIVEPTQVIVLLGIVVNSIDMTLSVESERLDKALELIELYESQLWLTLKQTQSLMGHLNFIAQVIRFARLFSRGLASMIVEFNNWARSKGLDSSKGHKLPLSTRALVDLKVWKPLLLAFNGIDVTAPALYPNVSFKEAQVDSSFWGSGFWAHGFFKSFVWKDLGIKIFDEKGEPMVSTSFVEALGLKYLLKTLAPYMKGKFVKLQIDNLGLVHMMRGEKTKSDQVLPIIIDCVSLIIAYNIKPFFEHISSEEMWFADPLSRLTQPGKEIYYKRLFSTRKKRFLKRNKPWKPSNPQEVANPKALEIPKYRDSLIA